MQIVTLVRGANGVVVWTHKRTAIDEISWICLRDSFRVVVPNSPSGLESFLQQIATHSSGLVGAIQQVVQLQI